MILDPNNILHLLPATLATNPGAVAVLPVFAPASPDTSLVIRARVKVQPIPKNIAQQLARAEAAGKGNGGPVQLPTEIEVGRLLLIVPADMAANLQGPEAGRHPLYLVSVYRSVYDAAVKQAETGIVLPGSGIVGSGIVRP